MSGEVVVVVVVVLGAVQMSGRQRQCRPAGGLGRCVKKSQGLAPGRLLCCAMRSSDCGEELVRELVRALRAAELGM